MCVEFVRELVRLHTLENQLCEAKDAISSKVAKAACHLPTKQVDQNAQSSSHLAPALDETQSATYPSPCSRRKRLCPAPPSSSERRKRRRIIEVTSSTTVAVRLYIMQTNSWLFTFVS